MCFKATESNKTKRIIYVVIPMPMLWSAFLYKSRDSPAKLLGRYRIFFTIRLFRKLLLKEDTHQLMNMLEILIKLSNYETRLTYLKVDGLWKLEKCCIGSLHFCKWRHNHLIKYSNHIRNNILLLHTCVHLRIDYQVAHISITFLSINSFIVVLQKKWVAN